MKILPKLVVGAKLPYPKMKKLCHNSMYTHMKNIYLYISLLTLVCYIQMCAHTHRHTTSSQVETSVVVVSRKIHKYFFAMMSFSDG